MKRVIVFTGGALLAGLVVLYLLHQVDWRKPDEAGSNTGELRKNFSPGTTEATEQEEGTQSQDVPSTSSNAAQTAQAGPAGEASQKEEARPDERFRGTVLPGLGPVEILDAKVEPGPHGTRQQVSLVKSSKAKHSFLRVVQNERASPPQISVADHVLVQFAEGVTDLRVAQLIQQEGFAIERRFQHSGLYVVGGFEPAVDAVPDAVTKLQALGADVQTVEPDYLHFALDSGFDQAWDTNSNLVSDLIRSEESLHEKRGRIAMLSGELVAPQLSATRTLTFDAPTFLGGVGTYAPYVAEQNMRVRNDSGGSYVNHPEDGWPDNGTNYIRGSSSAVKSVIHHAEDLPFALHQLDLAEYSTTYNSGQVELIGTLPDSMTVSQTLVLDGVIDGDGPLDDWQTFVLGAEFENVVSVKLNGTGVYSLDNIQVTVKGQETPEPPKPADPLYYDISFSEPIHQLDETMAVSGYYAPKSINMGNPIVRSSVGAMADQPVELKLGDGGFRTSSNYEQFRIGMGQAASEYRMELDVMVSALGPDIYSDSFTIHWDGNATQRLDFEENGKVRIFQSFVIGGGHVANYNLGQVYRLRFDVDMVAGAWKVFLDGVQIHSGPFNNTFDVRDIRIHFSDSTGGSGLAAVDNIKIWAFEAGSLIDPLLPDISVAPTSVDFGPVAQNTVATELVRIDNFGDDDLILTQMYTNQPEFSLVGLTGALPMTIAPDQSRDIAVRFSPTSGAATSGSLVIRSNDPDESFKVVPISGTGVVGQQISVSTQSVNVTLDPGESTTATLTLQNAGSGALTWNLASQGGSTTVSSSLLPDDPDFSLLWGLKNSTDFGAGIAATEAWSITTGSDQIVVGVIDTGVEWDHPDLAANIWSNADEIAGNGIDDDNNGFIDDVRGWDFFGNDANPMDTGGHGTHVAGTIAARGDNGIGVTGVAWNAKIMPIRFLGPAGGTTADAIESIDYATQNGAHLTNNSWGGGSPTTLLANAIARSQAQDMLFVAAAGNSALNADVLPMYPAAYTNSNIVSVAATDRYDQLAYFSNYGATSVDLAAPGRSIYSSFLRDGYHTLSGTSMASPHVAGAVALLLAQDSSRTFYQTKQLLLNHVDTISSLNGKVLSNGRLNVFNSLGGSGTPGGGWLTFGPNSGTLGGNSQQAVQLTFDAADLGPGSFTDIVTLTTNDPVRPTIDIQVALDVAGTGTTSTGPEITAQAQSVATTSGSDATFSVSASGAGSLTYQWFVGPVGDTSQPVGGDSATLTLSGVTQTTEVWVRVTEGFNSTNSEGAFASVALEAPASVRASDNLYTNQVSVNWLEVAGATGYQVSRLPNPHDEFTSETILGTTSGAIGFNDATAVPGQSYSYLVRAVNAEDEFGHSAEDVGMRATDPMDGTLLPILDRVDMVYTYDGSYLAVTGATGSIDFYDTDLHWVTRGIAFGREVGGIDAAQDSPTVLVSRPVASSATQGQVTKIDISTTPAAVNTFNYPLASGEGGSYDVAFLDDNLALVTTIGATAPAVPVPLRTLNPSTGLFTIRPEIGDIDGGTFLDRTPDGSKLAIFERYSGTGRFFTYTKAADTFSAPANSGTYHLSAGINRSGNQVAMIDLPDFFVAAENGTQLSTTPGVEPAGVAFSPITEQVYYADSSTDDVRGVDPATGAVLFTLPVPGGIDRAGNPFESGKIAVRPDGQELAVACVDGIRFFNISAYVSIDPPTAPLNLSASDSTTSAHVALSWDAATGASNYLVFRHTSDNSAAASQVDTVSANSFQDDSAEPGTTYFYWVKATSAGGSSDFSASDSGTRKIPTEGPTIDSQPSDQDVVYGSHLNLSVNATPVYGAVTYQWYRGGAGDTSQPVGTDSRTLNLADQTENASYWVRVSDSYGNSTDTVVATATVIPATPARGFATRGLFVDRVRLTWDPVVASSYQVYRSSLNFIVSATELATDVGGTVFSDTSAVPGDTYYYWVRAVDADGDLGEFRTVGEGVRAAAPLDGTLLPIYDRKDFVYSPAGDKLYVSSTSGMLEVYDRNNPAVEKTYRIGGELSGIDVSLDGTFLLASQLRELAGQTQGQVLQVDLSGTSWSGFPYDLELNEGGSRDVVLFSNTKALVNSQFNGSGLTPLRTLDLDTGLYVQHSNVSGNSFFARTPDRSKVAVFEGSDIKGEWFTYDALLDTFSGKTRADGFLLYGAVSPDGSFAAMRTHAESRVYSAAGSLLATLTGTGGVAFSPHKAQMYTVDSLTNEIRGYSTVNWAEQFTLAIPGGVFDSDEAFDHAWLKVSPNGEELAVATADGIRFLDIAALLPPDPPAAPTAVTASDNTDSNGVLVSWAPAVGADDYAVYRHTSDDSAGASLVTSGVTATSYLDTTASVGTFYYYWVKASNVGGSSAFSSSDVGIRKVGTPASMSASDGTSSDSIDVSWASVGAGASYEVFSNTTDDLGSATLLSTVSSLSVSDTTPARGATHFYWVRANSGASVGEFSGSDSGFKGLPAPTGVTASNHLGSRVTVSWDPVPGATEYEVYFGTSASWNSIQRLVGGTTATTIDDPASNFAARSDYYWFVRGGVSGVFSSYSTGAVGSRLIAPPLDLVATTGQINAIDLDWDLESDTRTGQDVYRSTTDDFSSAAMIATLDANADQFTDTETLPQTDYYYWVQAYRFGTMGEPSAAVVGRRIGGEFVDFADLYDLGPEESVLSADLDKDGQNTFAEWTLGGSDPNDASSTPTFVIKVRSIDGGEYLTLCFLRLAGGTETANRYTVAEAVYECQGTDRLGAWNAQPVLIPVPAGLPTPPTSYEWGCFRLPYEVSENPNGYLRVVVSEQNR